MRSEVSNLNRTSTECVVPDNARPVWRILSDLLPEIPVGETKSVRISAEIVDEKGEEKVGSKCEISRIDDAAYSYAYLDGIRFLILDPIVKDWQPGESRKVKSILFDTPSGVPEVTFCETPRERLKRETADINIGYALGQSDAVKALEKTQQALNDYLAATEEAAKKGGG